MVQYSKRKYLQKEGVCIGPAVTPISLEIYLNRLDSGVFSFLGGDISGFCSTIINNILVCTAEETLGRGLKRTVRESAPKLDITLERER